MWGAKRPPGGFRTFTRSVYVPDSTSTRALTCCGLRAPGRAQGPESQNHGRVAPRTLHTRACPGPDSLCPSGAPRQSSSWVWCLRKAKTRESDAVCIDVRSALGGGLAVARPRAATTVRAGGVRGVRIACTLAPMAPCIPRPPSGTCPWPQWWRVRAAPARTQGVWVPDSLVAQARMYPM